MRYMRFVAVGAVLEIVLFAVLHLHSATSATCKTPYRHDAAIGVGSNSIEAEVAKTDIQRTTGLSGRACIGTNQGMLFEFDNSGLYPFWMKDMKFSIDMIWISGDHKVVTVEPNISPGTYPKNFVSSRPAKYVLEIQAGRAQTLNITEGTNLQFNP